MNKSEKILREYANFKDINQSEPIKLLPLTVQDCMEEFAVESGKKDFAYGIVLGCVIGLLVTVACIGNSNENKELLELRKETLRLDIELLKLKIDTKNVSK